MTRSMPALFFLLALVALVTGMIFGILASLQYIFPDFAKDALDFSRTRPLHVSSVVGWIVSGASGVVWHRLSSWGTLPRAVTLHFGLFLLSGLLVTTFLASGLFGGREYMAFSPALSAPILLGWIAFAAGFFAFALFFLGLFNLMFGWAHHTYIVPAQPWVRIVSYGVIMTELIVAPLASALARIVRLPGR